jgi:hypothetical protein
MTERRAPLRQRGDTNQDAAAQRQPRSGVHNWLPAERKAWLDGELSEPRVLMVWAQLLICPACREEVTWLKRLGEDMRDLERAVPSPRLRSRILAALPETPPGRPAHQRPIRARWAASPVLAFGAVAAFAAIIITFLTNRPAGNHVPVVTHNTGTGSTVAHAKPSAAAYDPVKTSEISHKPDPYSAEADRLFAQYLRDQENRSARLLARNRSNWTGFVTTLRNERKIGQTGGTLTLAVAVPDVNEAENALNSWARSSGGGSASPDAGQGGATVAPMVTTKEQPTMPPSGAPTFEGRIVTLRVPVARIASLEPVLRRLGVWGSTSRMGLPPIPASRAATRIASVPANIGSPTDARPDDRVRPSAAPSSVSARSGAADQVTGRDTAEAFLTVRFQLSSLGISAP